MITGVHHYIQQELFLFMYSTYFSPFGIIKIFRIKESPRMEPGLEHSQPMLLYFICPKLDEQMTHLQRPIKTH
jgi:hypothetical protein